MKSRSLSVALSLAALAVPARGLEWNLLPNGEFDDADDVDGWTEPSLEFTNLQQISEDADDCSGSGSADGNNISPIDNAVGQFVGCSGDFVIGQQYVLSGVVRFPVATSTAQFQAELEFTDEADCFGFQVGPAATIPEVYDSGVVTEWTEFRTGVLTAPVGAVSVRAVLSLKKIQGEDGVADLFFDRVQVTRTDFVFAEDFEIGSACRWSVEVGVE